MPQANLLEFNFIKVKIPRKAMLKDLEKTSITPKTFHKYRKLRHKLELASYQTAHAISVLDRILLKAHEYDV